MGPEGKGVATMSRPPMRDAAVNIAAMSADLEGTGAMTPARVDTVATEAGQEAFPVAAGGAPAEGA